MTLYNRIDAHKAQIDAVRPFEHPMLAQLRAYYRIGLTWSSNALEGNTLTESETKVLLEDGLTVGGKPLRDTFEALGHAQAYDFMFSLLGSHDITEADMQTMHRMFYSDIDAEAAGVYRSIPVFITGSAYPVWRPGAHSGGNHDLVCMGACPQRELSSCGVRRRAAQAICVHPSVH